MHIAYTVRLSINKDLKLKKREGKDKQQHEKLYTITKSRDLCVYHNVYYNCHFASAVTVARLHITIRPKRHKVLANLLQARRDLIYILL